MKIKMKYKCLFARVSIMLFFAALMLPSCVEKLNLTVSPRVIEFDANPTEAQTINISANVEWNATIMQEDEWITIDLAQGSGNATISITAIENGIFTERNARIVITGEGVKTDTVRILQFPSLDVAELIEDEVFRQYCLEKYDREPQDGKISLKEAKSTWRYKTDDNKIIDAREIIVNYYPTKENPYPIKIKSLAGIEYFSKIIKLNCSGNEITNIDLSKNTELRILDCSFNPIDHIDVSIYPKLTDLFLYDIGLTNIDVSKNVALQWLAVSNNEITSIDVSNNNDLEGLECNYNKLTRLDISKNPKLKYLQCVDNQLKELDVSKNTNLVYFYCYNNDLSNIDLSKNLSLQSFSGSNNNFTRLDVSNNISLTQLFCDNNPLTTLDISQNTKLTNLQCSNTKLSGSIDISNNIPRPDEGYMGLMYLNLKRNPTLTTIFVWKGFDKENKYYEVDDIKLYQEK